jgi:hypothetical protein
MFDVVVVLTLGGGGAEAVVPAPRGAMGGADAPPEWVWVSALKVDVVDTVGKNKIK